MAKLQRVLVVLSLFISPVLFAQSADVSVTATDSPDPVQRGGTITYTVNVTNSGPDPATNATMSVYNSSGLGFVSVTTPAGWTCTPPAPGAFVQFSCTNPNLNAAAVSTFTIVATTDTPYYGNAEGTIATAFSAGSSTPDPNGANNLEQENTAYVVPDADMGVTVTDSPDPVFPRGSITYTVEVSNGGPDPAIDALLSVNNSSGLGFVSVTAPAGWTCTPPAPGAFVQFSCTNPNFAAGATSTFTVVATTDTVYYGNAEGTVTTAFSVGSGQADPNGANNIEQENTAYVTPDADLSITATDAPDPVGRDEDITYTVTLTNSGPDSAAATLNVPMNGFLKFTSMTVPAGFVCTGVPPAGGAASYSCVDTTFAPGDTATFTIVMHTDPESFGINDGVITQPFTVTGDVTDPDNADNQVVVSTTYDVTTADLGMTATDSPDPVNAGSNITYSGTVTNAGPDAGPGVTLTIPLHPSLLFQSITQPAGFTCTTPAIGVNGTITCTSASVASGAVVPFTVVAQVDPSLANGPDGIIDQGFILGSSAGDPNGANNELEVFTQFVAPDADLSVTNSDSPDPVVTGGTITYTQTLTNNGPDTATNVTFSQTLPGSVGFVSLAAPAGFSCTTPAVGGNGAINCTSASLATGVTGPFTLVVEVLASSGTIGNTVTADAATFDPDVADNSATTSTTIVAAASADLRITKTTTTTAASPGDTIQFTIVATNAGPDDATSVTVTDVLPAGLLFQSISAPAGFSCVTPAAGSGGTITCTGATLADGATATFQLFTTVAAGADSGTLTNSATVAAATGDPNGANGSGTSNPIALAPGDIADLSLVKNTTTTTATSGSTFMYTITITNAGPDAAQNVVMSDALPAGLLFEAIAVPAGFTCTTPAVGANGTVNCTAATLANGATASFTLTVRVAPSASGTVTNSATVVSATDDVDGTDTTDDAPPVTLAPASADLSIVKSTTASGATTGGTLRYTITVTNAGPSTATNVVVVDTLPAGLQLISATPSQGTCSGTTTVTCNLGSLLSGSDATVTLQTRVTAAGGSVIENSATVSATQPDPNGGDNASTAPDVPVTAAPAAVAAIPTLSEWGLLAFALLLGGFAVLRMRSA